MRSLFRSISSPILSLIILTLGNSLFTTFVSIRLKMDNQPTEIIGYISGAFFTGIVVGSIRVNRMIERIGHIRSFSAFAALITITTMLQAIFINPWTWLALRFVGGFCLAGLLITIESWLLTQSTKQTKGKVLSIYMTAYYAAQVGGQFFLNLSDPMDMLPYAITIIFSALSIVPVAVTKSTAPIMPEPSYLNVFKLLKIAPLGVVGSAISGIMMGAVYGLLPIYAKEMGKSIASVSWMMAITIFGGLLLQWPIGHLSDLIDRRKVIFTTGFMAFVISIAIAFVDGHSLIALYVLAALFGGFSFTLYPLSICHASDKLDYKDIISATAALSLAYGVGAVIGPIIASFTMNKIGSAGLFYYFAICSIFLFLFTLMRIIKKEPVPKEEKTLYRNFPRTTPLASELNPTADEEEEKEKEASQEKK